MLQLGPMLSVTLAPLVPRCGGSLPRALERIVAGGARAVQLSAAQKDLRPRDLDRQTRRELLSLIARRGLMLGGLDFMIPHKDYLQSATQDRAVAAAVSAIALAADLGRVPLSLSLPVEKLADEVAASLLAAADGHGVALAVHAEHDLEALSRFLAKHGQPLLGAGLDPAALIAAGHDPAATAAQFAPVLGVARLDDHARTSQAAAGGRCPLGAGELDVLEYRAALAVAPKLRGIVVELRGLAEPLAGLRAALEQWEHAGPL
jgi:sugar phosphate isomerase/epimerase